MFLFTSLSPDDALALSSIFLGGGMNFSYAGSKFVGGGEVSSFLPIFLLG